MVRKLIAVLMGMFVFCSAFGQTSNTWMITGALNTARHHHTLTLLSDGKVLAFGGSSDGVVSLASAEVYDPAIGKWSSVASANDGHCYHAAVRLQNGKVLVVGGLSNSTGPVTARSEIYDPATNKWTLTAPMITPCWYHDATVLPNGNVLVTGGRIVGNSSIKVVQIYNPNTNTWTVGTPLLSSRCGHCATLLSGGNFALISGGSSAYGYFPMSETEIYDVANNLTTVTGKLSTARFSHSATLLSNNLVLVAGGASSAGAIATAELFNSTSGSWSNATTMGITRPLPAAVSLLNNQILQVGGPVNQGAEVYNFVLNQWIVTGPLNFARAAPAVTLLDGRVLTAGGWYNSLTEPLASSEIYYCAGPVQTVVVAGGSASVETSNQTLPYVAIVRDASGNMVYNTNNATLCAANNATLCFTPIWTTGGPSDSGTASINSAGIATGEKDGVVTINAISGSGVNGTATLNVFGGIGPISSILVSGNSTVLSGEKVTFIATGLGLYDNPIPGLTFTWSAISGTGTATINSAGVATGSGVGTVTIQAASGGKIGTAPLNVTVGALASIAITGGSSSVVSGAQTPAFDVIGYDVHNNLITPKPTVTWSTGAPGDIGTASIDSNGVVTGERDGTVTIKATSGGITGTTILNVTGSYGGITSVAVTGGATSIPTGAQTPAFIAKALDIYNNTMTGVTFTWATGDVGDTGTATIDASSGIATGGNVGKVTVKATSGNKTGTAELDVTVVPIKPVDQSSSSTGAIIGGAVGAAAVAVIATAVTCWFKKYRNMADPITVSEEGVTKESTIITTDDGGFALMTVSIKNLQ